MRIRDYNQFIKKSKESFSCQLGRDLLLHVVPQHGEDLLHKRVQLLLEEQRRVLGLHLRIALVVSLGFRV